MTDLQQRPKKLSVNKMIPNLITLTALAAGMTSIKMALVGKWEEAVVAIAVAAFLDAFDGAAARLLKAQSKLGAELDSFSDFVSFGVAPALVMYMWTLDSWHRWGWPIALVFAMSVALRLSRFNIASDEKDPNDPLGKYFTGVPSPMGGGLALLPLIVSFQTEAADADVVRHPQFVGAWMLVVGAMMVSNIPTFSSKQLRVPYRFKFPLLALFALIISGLINEPWPTFTLIAAVYLLAMPFGVRQYNKKASAIAAGEKTSDDDADE